MTDANQTGPKTTVDELRRVVDYYAAEETHAVHPVTGQRPITTDGGAKAKAFKAGAGKGLWDKS